MTTSYNEIYDEFCEQLRTSISGFEAQGIMNTTGNPPRAWDVNRDIFYENTGRIKPADTESSWVRPSIRWEDSEQLIIGGGLWQEIGNFYVQIFAPKNKGMRQVQEYGEILKQHFRGFRPRHISTRTKVNLRTAPENHEPESAWYQANLEIKFRFNQVSDG